MSKELRRRFYAECERLDTRTLALLLNTVRPGIDWRGCPKAEMLNDVYRGIPENFMDKLTERHVQAASVLAEKVEHHRRNISSINAAHNHDLSLVLESI